MLSEKTIQTIQSTIPVLEIHGTAITKAFYEMMFTNHPELLNIFNHANQKQGRQQAALANTIYAAAAHIENLAAILPVVKQIAHKHRGLGVKAEHYPIVGEHLLLAIKQVLGDAATDDIIEAWGEAYGVIADVFISVEAEMYEATMWQDFRPFIIDKKIQETDAITSFYLKPEDGKALAPFHPGQYITVKVQPNGDSYTHLRQYSLSDTPDKDYYRITVKREEGNDKPSGIVSNELHQNKTVGDRILLSAPAGDFVLQPTEKPIVLISGGVGLTPMVSMLHTLAAKQAKDVTFIHATSNSKTYALKQEIESTIEKANFRHLTCFTAPTETDRQKQNFTKEGYLDATWLQSIIQNHDASYYLCGPVSFMQTVYNTLTNCGIPTTNIHHEFFGPAASLQK